MVVSSQSQDQDNFINYDHFPQLTILDKVEKKKGYIWWLPGLVIENINVHVDELKSVKLMY